MTRLAFASSPALLAFLALAAALGLWLTWALYFRANLPLGAPARRALALLTALAWLALTWFGAGAALNRHPAVYHPPAVVLALDASESFGATGGREASAAALRQARAHYEARGFRVVSLAFAESVAPFSGVGDEAGLERFAGERTSFAALARALDSLQIPNLQAVILASDGRASAGGASALSWSAPVHPLRIERARDARPEAQGEDAEIDWTRPEEGATLALRWSASRDARAVTAEIRDGGRTLWTATLREEASRDAGAADWTPALSEFRLPASLTRSARPETWTLRVVPAPNPVAQNDRVEIRFKGLAGAREIVARPLSSLEERGLIDALKMGDSGAVFAAELALVKAGAEDVVWVRAGRSLPAGFIGTGIEYLPARGADDAARGDGLFGADARVRARDDGAEFLPASVLRLGDLGAEGLRLRAPGRDVEALAWAEQDGRKGLLLWRKPQTTGARAFGIALPPLWRPGFSPGAAPEARAAASRWVRGAAAWARAHGRARASLPDPVVAGRPFALEVRFPSGEGDFKNIHSYDLYENDVLLASARGASSVGFDSLTLEAGERTLSLRRGSRVVWTGSARVRAPRDLELGKLGVDGRALAEIAASSNGNIIRHEINSNVSWPALPGGQARETRARSTPLAPAAFALGAALLLCAAWALRKRLQLD